MKPNEWAAIAVAATTLIAAVSMGVRHLVKHYLFELKQNGGTSIKDQISRLESRVDQIMILLVDFNKPKKRKSKNEESINSN